MCNKSSNCLKEWNGNSVFTHDEADLEADGTPFNIEVELIEGSEEEDDEDEEEED